MGIERDVGRLAPGGGDHGDRGDGVDRGGGTGDEAPRSRPHARGRLGWIWSAAAVDGIGTGATYAALTVLVARRFGIASAGLTIGIASAGRFAALAGARWVERHARAPAHLERVFHLLVVALVVASGAVLASAAWGPYWSTLVLGFVVTACNNLTSSLLMSEGRAHVVRLGPASMTGQALGAVVVGGAFVAGGAPGIVLLAAAVLVQWGQVLLLGRYGFAPLHHDPVGGATLVGPGVKGFVLAVCAYGPLGIYAALVRDVAGVAWVGPAMIAYALGALSAAWWDRKVRVARHWPALLVFGAVGVGTWAFAWSAPLVLVGRLVSGAALFVAPGRLQRSVAEAVPGPAGLSAVSTGLGAGAGVGSVAAGALAGAYGVAVMGAVLTFVSLVVLALVDVGGQGRRERAQMGRLGLWARRPSPPPGVSRKT